MDAWTRLCERGVSLLHGVVQVTRETLAGVKAELGRVVIDAASEREQHRLRIAELENTVRHYQSDVKELTKQRDVANANNIGLQMDVARFGGMLDAYRDAKMIPPRGETMPAAVYNINNDPYAWRGK